MGNKMSIEELRKEMYQCAVNYEKEAKLQKSMENYDYCIGKADGLRLAADKLTSFIDYRSN